MNSKQLTSAGFILFDSDRGHNAPTCAGINLSGRTHYVDPDTRRFFRARILKAVALCDGLIFGIIESASADYENSRRIFRPVFFDLDGNVIARTDLADCFRTKAGAEKEFWRMLDKIDAIAATRELLGKLATAANSGVHHFYVNDIGNYDRVLR